MRRVTLIMALAACACTPTNDAPDPQPSELQDSGLSSIEPLPTARDADRVSAEKTSRVATEAAPISIADEEPDKELALDNGTADPAEQCWADYCPCDRKNPDYGFLDISLCRNIRMGVHVSDAEFSIGAQSRDARKALREFKEDNP